MSSPVPTVGPLEHLTLRAQVRRALRASIVTGALEPGRLYSVGSFADQLGVSATPVREALGDLAQLGLVEVIRNRGFVVPELNEHDLDEILQLRLLLEPPAIEQIAGRLTEEEIATCRGLVEQGKAAAADANLTLFLEADREFHLVLVGKLGNARLVEILSRLRDQTRLYGLRELAADGQLVASALEHERLLEALEAGDPVRARDELVGHLRHTRGTWAGNAE